MKKKFLLTLVVIPILALIILFPWVHAAEAAGLVPNCGGTWPVSGNPQPACSFCDFFGLTSNVIEFALFQLGPALVALMIMIGAFFILAGGGNPGQVSKGKEIIKWAIIGYFLMLASWIIVNTIFMALDFNVSWGGLRQWYEIKCR